MRSSLSLLGMLATALAVPGGAFAAPAAPAHAGPHPEVGAPVPSTGRMSIRVHGGQRTRKRTYTAPGARLVIAARATPFAEGQEAVLEVRRRGRVVASQRAPIVRARRGGVAVFRLTVRRRGGFRLIVRHPGTATQGEFHSRSAKVRVLLLRAGQGSRGLRVLLLQRGLKRLGFAVPVTGYYDGGTSRAVLAFRKTSGLGRDGYATKRVYSLVLRNRGAFRPRFPRAGRHVEFDWSRQVLALISRGRAHHVYHASSGKASTPTVFGSFRFYRKQPGRNSHGMVHSNYFVGGYAVHGYASVPAYPASHGCIRVPIPNADEVDRQIKLGDPMFVYR